MKKENSAWPARVKNYMTPSGSLSQKTLRGSLWLFFLRYADQLLSFVKTVVLARILLPGDFGIFGIAVIATSFLDSFSQTGFQQALIQKKGDVKPYFDTAWLVHALRGIVLAVLLFIFSGYIAIFFATPQLALLIKIVSLTVVLEGASSIAVVHASKELQFHKYFLYQISGSCADFILSIISVILFRNYWVLIIGLVASITARFIVSYVVYPYWPRFSFSMEKTKELLRFGKWIFGSNLVGFLITQTESILVGRFLGVALLGFYQMAYKISSFLNVEIISGAIMPAYSKIQDNMAALRESYLKTLKLYFFLFLPMTGGIFVLAGDFLKALLGTKWLPSTGALQILVWVSFFWALAVLSGPLFQAIGRPHVETVLNTLRLVVLLVAVYPFIMAWGITGAALAVLCSVLVSSTGYVVSILLTIHISPKEVLAIFLPPLLASATMVLAVFLVKHMVPANLVGVIMISLFGALFYFVAIFLIEKSSNYKIYHLVKKSASLLVR